MKKTIRLLALVLALLLALHSGALAELDALQGMLDALNGENEASERASEEEVEPSSLDALESLLDELGGDDEGESGPEPAAETDESPEADPETAPEEAVPEEDAEATHEAEETSGAGSGGVSQADYVLLDGYSLTSLNDTVAVQVPSGWGNNAGISEAMISYSPTNGSGVADPNSSTLSTIWYDDGKTGNDKLGEYIENIRKSDIFSDVDAEPSTVAGQPGVALSYMMNVGTNSFLLKSACFVYDDILYSVEMCQGNQSARDYFPVYEDVISSEAVMAGEWDFSAQQPVTAEPTQQPATTEPTQEPATAEPTREPATAEPTQQPATLAADLGDFTYAINGHSYQFPTDMGALIGGDINIDTTLVLSAEKNAAAGNELANTLYFMLAGAPARELIGVTNLKGANVPMTEGVLTALVDTQASALALELPGGLRIGSAESSISDVFPEFSGRAMDGLAGFRGNDLLYACNVRDDGNNGYALIRNDMPYCSALTIICEDGFIREINFQCLGAAVAGSIFAS